MSVCIRLKRSGRKHLPFYHICVFNSRTRRDGRPIEQVGFYDPASNSEETLRVDVDRVKYWLAEGAKPSTTVGSLLRKQGVESSLWATKPNKKRKKVEGAADKKMEQKKTRSVKARKKGRTANSKTRAEKKTA